MYDTGENAGLGIELPEWLRDTANAVRDTLLQRGGRVIADSPQGQAAIRAEVQRRLLERGTEVAQRAAVPVGLLAAAGLGLFLLLRRR